MIYDFVCAPPEEYGESLDDDLHTTLVEFPTYTFTGKLTDMCSCLCDIREVGEGAEQLGNKSINH